MRPIRVVRYALLLVIGLTALLVVDILVLMFFFARPPHDMARSNGPNAVWAEHDWVAKSHNESEYDALVAEFTQNAITDVFFAVGPLRSDGTIDPSEHPNAAALVAALHERLPRLRAQAWIGRKETATDDALDLGNETVRGNIVATAARFLGLGFDGIHYNIEPISDGDRHLLALLDETRPVVDSNGAVLSMATAEIEPFPGARRLLNGFLPEAGIWSRDYYGAVAARVDQIAVMMYDTGIPMPWAYSAAVAWSTMRIWRSIGPETTLFVGLPTHEEEHRGLNAEAENLKSALTGVARSMPRDRSAPRLFGLAVYARWTTDEAEWAYWRKHWLGMSD